MGNLCLFVCKITRKMVKQVYSYYHELVRKDCDRNECHYIMNREKPKIQITDQQTKAGNKRYKRHLVNDNESRVRT